MENNVKIIDKVKYYSEEAFSILIEGDNISPSWTEADFIEHAYLNSVNYYKKNNIIYLLLQNKITKEWYAIKEDSYDILEATVDGMNVTIGKRAKQDIITVLSNIVQERNNVKRIEIKILFVQKMEEHNIGVTDFQRISGAINPENFDESAKINLQDAIELLFNMASATNYVYIGDTEPKKEHQQYALWLDTSDKNIANISVQYGIAEQSAENKSFYSYVFEKIDTELIEDNLLYLSNNEKGFKLWKKKDSSSVYIDALKITVKNIDDTVNEDKEFLFLFNKNSVGCFIKKSSLVEIPTEDSFSQNRVSFVNNDFSFTLVGEAGDKQLIVDDIKKQKTHSTLKTKNIDNNGISIFIEETEDENAFLQIGKILFSDNKYYVKDESLGKNALSLDFLKENGSLTAKIDVIEDYNGFLTKEIEDDNGYRYVSEKYDIISDMNDYSDNLNFKEFLRNNDFYGAVLQKINNKEISFDSYSEYYLDKNGITVPTGEEIDLSTVNGFDSSDNRDNTYLSRKGLLKYNTDNSSLKWMINNSLVEISKENSDTQHLLPTYKNIPFNKKYEYELTSRANNRFIGLLKKQNDDLFIKEILFNKGNSEIINDSIFKERIINQVPGNYYYYLFDNVPHRLFLDVDGEKNGRIKCVNSYSDVEVEPFNKKTINVNGNNIGYFDNEIFVSFDEQNRYYGESIEYYTFENFDNKNVTLFIEKNPNDVSNINIFIYDEEEDIELLKYNVFTDSFLNNKFFLPIKDEQYEFLIQTNNDENEMPQYSYKYRKISENAYNDLDVDIKDSDILQVYPIYIDEDMIYCLNPAYGINLPVTQEEDGSYRLVYSYFETDDEEQEIEKYIVFTTKDIVDSDNEPIYDDIYDTPLRKLEILNEITSDDFYNNYLKDEDDNNIEFNQLLTDSVESHVDVNIYKTEENNDNEDIDTLYYFYDINNNKIYNYVSKEDENYAVLKDYTNDFNINSDDRTTTFMLNNTIYTFEIRNNIINNVVFYQIYDLNNNLLLDSNKFYQIQNKEDDESEFLYLDINSTIIGNIKNIYTETLYSNSISSNLFILDFVDTSILLDQEDTYDGFIGLLDSTNNKLIKNYYINNDSIMKQYIQPISSENGHTFSSFPVNDYLVFEENIQKLISIKRNYYTSIFKFETDDENNPIFYAINDTSNIDNLYCISYFDLKKSMSEIDDTMFIMYKEDDGIKIYFWDEETNDKTLETSFSVNNNDIVNKNSFNIIYPDNKYSGVLQLEYYPVSSNEVNNGLPFAQNQSSVYKISVGDDSRKSNSNKSFNYKIEEEELSLYVKQILDNNKSVYYVSVIPEMD